MIVDTEEESSHGDREFKLLDDAHKVAGRSILFILYDRSIKSSPQSFGKRRRKTKYLFDSGGAVTSPSSVISDCKTFSMGTLDAHTHATISRPSLFSPKENYHQPTPRLLRKYKNIPYSANISNEIIHFAEKLSLSKPRSCYLPLSPNSSSPSETNRSYNAVSTIAIAFAPDGRTMASTHGDHTVKVSCCHTRRLIRSLVGHLRTPWTVKYHPTNPNMIASGCLGFQVRIWDWNYRSERYDNNPKRSEEEQDDDHYRYEETKGVCLYTLNLQDAAIISVSFHPSGTLLAIASGNMLFLWDYANCSEKELKKMGESIELLSSSSSQDMDIQNDKSESNTGSTTSYKYLSFNFKYTLRCVCFPPNGETILVGVANPVPDGDKHRRNDKKGAGYSLCLLNFDIKSAFTKLLSKNPMASSGSTNILKNVRIIIPRVLLYNDGGLDVSYDGKTLCACAEILLPYGTDCVMDMPEHRKGSDSDEEDSEGDDNDAEENENENKSTIFDSPPRSPSISASTETVDECRTPPPSSDNRLESMPPPCPPLGSLRRYALEAAQERRLRLQFARPTSSTVVTDEQLETAIQTRLVPHVVTVNIDTGSKSKSLGQILEAVPLSESKAPGVTCVKFSPSTEYCLLGFGVRDKETPMDSSDDQSVHPVISIYRCKGSMSHVATALSTDDDVNIALFHPESGHGLAYGTKQGRVKVLGPTPWK